MVATDGKIDDAKRSEIRSAVSAYRESRGLPLGVLADGIDASESYVSQSLSGKLAAHLADPILLRLNEWIEQHAARVDTRGGALVMTRPAERLLKLARRVKATNDIGLAYGPAGIGKTLTAKLAAEQLFGCYVRVTRDSRSGSGLLRAIYSALAGGAEIPQRKTVEDVLRKIGRSERLLLIDQAHDLKDEALPVLMDLHDSGRVPILLVGTSRLTTRLDRDRDATFGQISSRVGYRHNLLPEGQRRDRPDGGDWITIDQVRSIFARGRVRLRSDAARFLLDLLNGHTVGYLRFAGKAVSYAALQVSGGRTDTPADLSADMLRRAIARLSDADGDAQSAAADAPPLRREASA